MRCRGARRDLIAFLDGELPEARREWMRAHLEGCPACRREREALEGVRLALERLEGPGLSEAASADAVLERAASAGAGAPPGRPCRVAAGGEGPGVGWARCRWAASFGAWRPAAVLGAVLAAVALWQVLPRPGSQAPPTEQEIILAEGMELFENLDVIRCLPVLEGGVPVGTGAGGRS